LPATRRYHLGVELTARGKTVSHFPIHLKVPAGFSRPSTSHNRDRTDGCHAAELSADRRLSQIIRDWDEPTAGARRFPLYSESGGLNEIKQCGEWRRAMTSSLQSYLALI
jgi:hypothetical protein